jgi:hypothetical protein
MMMRSTILHAALAAALFAALPLSANAAISYGGGGLTGSFAVENFDANAGDGSAAGSQFTGITFGAGNYVASGYNGSYPNMVGSVIANFYPCCANPTSFSFSSALSELAFAFVSNPQTTTFSSFLGGNPVDVNTFSTGYSGGYVQFSGLFDSIGINSGSEINYAYIVDNMQMKLGSVSPVPEPETYLMLLAGLGLVTFGVRQRRQNAESYSSASTPGLA